MSERASTEIKCSDCGKTAIVPFKPTAGKPVYCRECLGKHRSSRPKNGRQNGNLDPQHLKMKNKLGLDAQRKLEIKDFFNLLIEQLYLSLGLELVVRTLL